MKRVVFSDTNKRSALEAFLPKVEAELESRFDGEYVALVDTGNDCISIRERSKGGPVVAELKLATEDSEVTRSKFRRATDEDIRRGLPLYVREKYQTTVKKRVPELKEIINIVDKLAK